MHTSAAARRSVIRITLALTLCVALLTVQNAVLVINSASAQGQSGNPNREGRPKPGKPEGSLPDLEAVQNESRLERQPAPPIPSTIRSPKVPLEPWNGRFKHSKDGNKVYIDDLLRLASVDSGRSGVCLFCRGA